MQVFLEYQPACLEDMWRCGALPGLVVSVAKAMDWQGKEAGSAHALLRDMLQAAPTFAVSAERQQFVLLVLARFWGPEAAWLLQVRSDDSGGACLMSMPQAGSETFRSHIDKLLTAAQQLAGQPLLRQQLETAAPALVASADAVRAIVEPCSSHLSPDDPDELLLDIEPEPLQLLASLYQQLDPLALRLPGCHNPACTSLAGASEAAMVLKTCAGCRVAR